MFGGIEMIKAIFFDIDGTLIQHGDTAMPKSTMDSLIKMKKMGIKLFIATGRPINTTGHVQAMFDFDGYVTANGQYCVNQNGLIHEQYIPKSSLLEIIPYINEHKIPVVFASLERSYINEYNKKQYDAAWPTVDLYDIVDEKIVQIMAYIEEKDDDAFLAHLPGCKTARWTPMFADIIPSDGGKEAGIDHVLAHYGISLDEAMCFGDGGNDITMLRHVPHSVAMGNANDKVKASASYVTTHINEDGIYNALKHFGVLD